MFPEFRAWHEIMKPLFGTEPPDWTQPLDPEMELPLFAGVQGEIEEALDEEDEEGGEE